MKCGWKRIGIVSAALVLAGCGQETQRKLEETQKQLAQATNEIVATRAQVSEVKTQMQAKMEELQQTVTKLTEEKADSEKRASALKSELEGTRQELEMKVTGLERDKSSLTNEVKALNDQLVQVNRRLSELETTHATTVAHLQAMREEFVKLTNEKDALEAKLHDLKSLKEQINVVKRELHEKKVEEIKRIERAESAMGNQGYLLKQGAWTVAREPGNYPLTQELSR